MPDNKKHHYVPRFYLKRFSSNERCICLWNIPSERKVLAANIENQCYKNYFYGKKPEVEKLLGNVEGQASRLLRQIDQSAHLPLSDSEDYLLLTVYMLMQFGRTEEFSNILKAMFKKVVEHQRNQTPIGEENIFTKHSSNLEYPAKYSLALAALQYEKMSDMACKLLINQTDLEFVTSDNPVVFHNQLFAFQPHGSNKGLSAKGLEIFFPITPNKLLLFYDPGVYSVGMDDIKKVVISNREDIDGINLLQIVSAQKNIYYRNADLDIEGLHRRVKRFTDQKKEHLSLLKRLMTGENIAADLSLTDLIAMPNTNLTFIELTESAKRWRNEFQLQRIQPPVVVRDEREGRDVKEFMEEVGEQDYDLADFIKFLLKKHINVKPL